MELNLVKTPIQLFSRKLVSIKYVQLIIKDIENASTNKTQQKINFLLSSYNVFLMAAFESFLKDLADFTAQKLNNEKKSKIMIILSKTNSEIKSFDQNLTNEKDRLHSCITKNINRLFRNGFGLQSISDSWIYADMDNAHAKEKVDSIYRIRGSIVHKGIPSMNLSYEENYERMEFLFSVAGKIQNHLFSFIDSL
jgi:hypothetical protein